MKHTRWRKRWKDAESGYHSSKGNNTQKLDSIGPNDTESAFAIIIRQQHGQKDTKSVDKSSMIINDPCSDYEIIVVLCIALSHVVANIANELAIADVCALPLRQPIVRPQELRNSIASTSWRDTNITSILSVLFVHCEWRSFGDEWCRVLSSLCSGLSIAYHCFCMILFNLVHCTGQAMKWVNKLMWT